MKVLYFLLGIFTGMWLTSNVAVLVIQRINNEFDKSIPAFVLTGYSEGWERGRFYAEARLRYTVYGCLEELKRLQKPHAR